MLATPAGSWSRDTGGQDLKKKRQELSKGFQVRKEICQKKRGGKRNGKVVKNSSTGRMKSQSGETAVLVLHVHVGVRCSRTERKGFK